MGQKPIARDDEVPDQRQHNIEPGSSDAAPSTVVPSEAVTAEERPLDAHQGHSPADAEIGQSQQVATTPPVEPSNLNSTVIGSIHEDPEETLPDGPAATHVSGGGALIGEYRVTGELGRGGMGVVYKAVHRRLQRTVAIKMVLVGEHAGREALQRFLAEARAVARLQHPGIVQIFEISEHKGLPYIALEYVEGDNLHRSLGGQPRDAMSSAALVETLALSMQYAHDNGVLHRDLKPANVLLDKEGHPKITDFGLAKQVDAEASMSTRDGTIMGSPSYMPPEQARGETASISTRSDLYSLGAILYQMLTGRPPFITDRPLDTVMQVIHNDAVSPRQLQPSLPVDIETICLKALQKNPEARYASCHEFAADLRRFLNGEPILARPVTSLERFWRWCRRNPKIAFPSALASFFVAATAVIATWAWAETSALAATIADERDNVKDQRDEAERLRGVAVSNEEQAKRERAEADRQRVIADQQKLLAEENEKLARRQAMLSLKTIQLVVTDIDGFLAKLSGATEIRIGLLEILSKKWDELSLEMVGGLEGEAIPTLMTVRFKIAQAWVSVDKVSQANTEFEKLEQQARRRFEIKGRTDDPRDNLARILTVWSAVRKKLTGDPATSTQMLEEALALYREILRDPRPAVGSPPRFSFLQSVAQNSLSLANEYVAQGNLPKAESQFREGKDMLDTMLKELELLPAFAALPEETKAKERTKIAAQENTARLMTAYVRLRRGAAEEAVGMFEESLKYCRQAVAAAPEELAPKSDLAGLLRLYGISMTWVNRLEDAARLLGEAQQVAESVYEADPAIARNKSSLAATLYALASLRELEQRPPAEVTALFERCRLYRAEMYAANQHVRNRTGLMLAEARVGDPETAEKLVAELGTQTEKNGDLHIDRARALNQLAARCDGDRQTKLREESIAALERAIADGFLDPFRIKAEPDLASLRDTEGFRQILSKLEPVPVR